MESTLPHRVLTPARGFTLIEMMVVLAIIIIVTVIALSGQSGFDRTVALSNATYDVALSIREAQSYGVSSQAFSGTNNAGYGIYLRTADPTSYILFADTYPPVAANARPDAKPGDGLYSTSATPTELLKTYSLNNGFSIAAFCVYTAAGNRTCTTNGLTEMAVSFSRPNTRTTVKARSSSSWGTYQTACFTVSSSANDLRYVLVAENGQVSVVSACP